MKSFFKNVLSTIVGMVLAVIVIILLFIGIVSLSLSSINNEEISLTADIDSGGIYAVIQEKNPPIVTDIYPGNDASYYQNDFKKMFHL